MYIARIRQFGRRGAVSGHFVRMGGSYHHCTILVNDIYIHITVNLECALRHTRHTSEPAILWVD